MYDNLNNKRVIIRTTENSGVFSGFEKINYFWNVLIMHTKTYNSN